MHAHQVSSEHCAATFHLIFPCPAKRLYTGAMNGSAPILAIASPSGVRLPKLRPGVIHRILHLSRRLHCGFFLVRLSPQKEIGRSRRFEHGSRQNTLIQTTNGDIGRSPNSDCGGFGTSVSYRAGDWRPDFFVWRNGLYHYRTDHRFDQSYRYGGSHYRSRRYRGVEYAGNRSVRND